MKTIDKNAPVLVTGATGYVAGWIVKMLLEDGKTVHAAVRDPKNKKKIGHLDSIAKNSSGSIKYFKSDLLESGSYQKAMEGCELVFHTASPFTTDYKDPQKELIDPALIGTQNVLESAVKSDTVKRVVLTSSCAAIYSDAIDCQSAPGGMLNESLWNTTASLNYQPYSYSKTLAEKKAWEIQKSQGHWDLVTINPSFVMGPPLNANSNTSESMAVVKQLADGTMKMGAPRMGVGVVDVRDVASAHIKAGFTPEAKGRYITSAHNTNFLEMGLSLQKKFGKQFPLPKKAIPKWLLMLVGPMVNKLFTREYIRKNVDVEWKADNSKIKSELNMSFRPLQSTMEETLEALIKSGEL